MIIDTCEIIIIDHTCEIIIIDHTCEIIMIDHTCEIMDFISGGKSSLLGESEFPFQNSDYN